MSQPPVRRVNVANQITPRVRRRLQPVRPNFTNVRRQRKNFIIRVYSLAMVLISLTLIQWLLIISSEQLLQFFRDNYQITYLAVLGSLVLFTVFILFDEVRYIQPYSSLFALLLVECATFGMLRVLLSGDLDQMVVCALVSIVTMIVFTFSGIIIPRDFTLDSVPLCVLSMTIYLILWITILVVIILDEVFPVLVVAGIILVLLVVYIMYFAQLIDGSRTFFIRWSDYVFAALLVYFNFTAMYTLILLVMVSISRHKHEFDYEKKGRWPFD